MSELGSTLARRHLRRVALAIVLFSVPMSTAGAGGAAAIGAGPPRIVLSGPGRTDSVAGVCGAAGEPLRAGSGPKTGVGPPFDQLLEPGDPVYFDIQPATIPLGYTGRIRVLNFMIVGDLPRIELSLYGSSPVRSFDRASTRLINGVQVSIFDISFPGSDLRAADPPPPIRFDNIEAAVADTTRYLRLRPATIPATRVVKINDRVQYSSHVVNIVAPYDGVSVFGLPAEEIAAEFYRHFTDTYEELAFVPTRVYWSPSRGAYHQFVYQDIDGIGLDAVDRRDRFAGSTVLRDWIFLARGDMQSNFLSVHETGHNWGFFMSLPRAGGIPLNGATECAGLEYDGTSVHAPLMGARHSFLSQCLWSPRRLSKMRNQWIISEADSPLTYHPVTLYAMGLIPAREVPLMFVANKQGWPSSLEPGTRLKGKMTPVSMDDLLAYHGERRGPAVPPVWRRATIIVSPERLLSAQDLRWFNYYAKRISDPEGTGVESLDRIPSFEVATGGRVDLRTEIRPIGRPRIAGNFAVSYPSLGKRDVHGLALDKLLVSRYEVGKTYVISGRVRQPAGHTDVTVRIGDEEFVGAIGSSGRFTVRITLQTLETGPKFLRIGLDGLSVVLAQIAPVYAE